MPRDRGKIALRSQKVLMGQAEIPSGASDEMGNQRGVGGSVAEPGLDRGRTRLVSENRMFGGNGGKVSRDQPTKIGGTLTKGAMRLKILQARNFLAAAYGKYYPAPLLRKRASII